MAGTTRFQLTELMLTAMEAQDARPAEMYPPIHMSQVESVAYCLAHGTYPETLTGLLRVLKYEPPR